MVDAHRKAIESQYIGLCTITEYQAYKDPVAKVTKHKEVDVLENQPCRLSFDRVIAADQTDVANAIFQTPKLFIAPEIVVRPGSKLTVTQNGRTVEYQNSGVPAPYGSHQEIQLKLFERWA